MSVLRADQPSDVTMLYLSLSGKSIIIFCFSLGQAGASPAHIKATTGNNDNMKPQAIKS
jgi:hypothetical protein